MQTSTQLVYSLGIILSHCRSGHLDYIVYGDDLAIFVPIVQTK